MKGTGMDFDRPLTADSQEEQEENLRRTDNGPTVDNEEELLREEFGEPAANGVYGAVEESGEEELLRGQVITPDHRGAAASIEAMVQAAEKWLGVCEPNGIQRWYCSKTGVCGNFPWCDAAVTYWGWVSGNQPAVTFGGYYAYTVAHAEAFRKRGQWHTDVAGIRRGDIVFFDWEGSNSISRINHVGLVTSTPGRAVRTIEGNTSDCCKRRERYANTIVGYGRPKYK
jgi:cell wall-associated NlpC family hydrolase